MNKGILYMILSGLSYIVINTFVKILGQGPDQEIISGIQKYPIPEIILFRSIVTFVISYAVIRQKGLPLLGNNRKWLFVRGWAGVASLTLYFYTLHHLPLAIATTIQYLSPIFTLAFAVYLLKEKINRIQILFFVLAFSGIVFISFSKHTVGNMEVADFSPWWILVGLLSAAFAGLTYNAIAKVKDTDEPVSVVMYFPLVAIPVMTILTAFNYVIPQGKEWLILLMIGIFTHFAQLLTAKALHIANTASITPIKYLGSIYALLLGFFLFGEFISLYAFIGMLLILIGVIGNTYFRAERRGSYPKND